MRSSLPTNFFPSALSELNYLDEAGNIVSHSDHATPRVRTIWSNALLTLTLPDAKIVGVSRNFEWIDELKPSHLHLQGELPMVFQNALASVAVKDLKSATAWYERLLDAPASHPMPEVSEWTFPRGGGLQVYLLPERAGSCSATFAIDDIHHALSKLKKLNIPADSRADNARVKVIMIKDPDGNGLAIAQAIDATLAR